MSLINQMLQDLEQRSVGNTLPGGVPSGISGQIRAVREERRIHPAWWVALALAAALIGAVAWYLTRPVPPRQPAPNLALKIAPQLGALPSPVAQEPLPLDTAPPPPPLARIPTPTAPASVAEEPRPRAEPVREPVRDAAKQSEPKPQEAPRAAVEPAAKADDVKPVTKQFSELTPAQRAENNYREAAVMNQAGKPPEATTLLEQAVKLDPRHAGARQTLIGLLLQAKRTDDAVKQAQDGLALDPSQSGLTMILARVQLDQGDLRAALATMDHGLPYAGASAQYHAFLAALLIRDKRNKEAIDQYTVALTGDPQNGVWWMGLAMALQAENHPAEAREAFLRAKRSGTLTPELQAFVEQKLAQLPKPQ
jgi:MSHA biogenesis protein MshN